jgi:hypothetical protein
MSELRIEERKRSMKLFPKMVIGLFFIVLLVAISAFFINDPLQVKENLQKPDHQIIMNIAKEQRSVEKHNFYLANSVVYYDKLSGDTITMIGNALYSMTLRSKQAPDFEYVQQERIREQIEEEEKLEVERKKQLEIERIKEQKRIKEMKKRQKVEAAKKRRVAKKEKEAKANPKLPVFNEPKTPKSKSKAKPIKRTSKQKVQAKKLKDIESALNALDDLD